MRKNMADSKRSSKHPLAEPLIPTSPSQASMSAPVIRRREMALLTPLRDKIDQAGAQYRTNYGCTSAPHDEDERRVLESKVTEGDIASTRTPTMRSSRNKSGRSRRSGRWSSIEARLRWQSPAQLDTNGHPGVRRTSERLYGRWLLLR